MKNPRWSTACLEKRLRMDSSLYGTRQNELRWRENIMGTLQLASWQSPTRHRQGTKTASFCFCCCPNCSGCEQRATSRGRQLCESGASDDSILVCSLIQVDKQLPLFFSAFSGNASTQARFPERARNPTPKAVQKCLARHGTQEAMLGSLLAIVMDVSSAHKRIRLHDLDAGLSCFFWKGKIYQYTVGHFGAAWSAWWPGP